MLISDVSLKKDIFPLRFITFRL